MVTLLPVKGFWGISGKGGVAAPILLTAFHGRRVAGSSSASKTGTAMQSSKLGLRIWGIAIYLLSTELKGRASMKLHRDLGISQKAAWHLAHRLRVAWDDGTVNLFAGPMEVDEAYFGGKRANMSKAKRAELAGTGRGPVGKAAVVGAKDRETNRVAARVVASVDRATLLGTTVGTVSHFLLAVCAFVFGQQMGRRDS